MNMGHIQKFVNSDVCSDAYNPGKKRILRLLWEVSQVYKETMNRAVDGVCDICGKGNTSDIYKLKDVVPGYKRRPKKSPRLCYNHFCGWNLSLLAHQSNTTFKRCTEAGDDPQKICHFSTQKEMERKYGLTDEEVDLHFATYLSKQLLKESKLYKLRKKMIRLKEHVDIEGFTFDMEEIEDAVKSTMHSFIYHLLCRHSPQLWIDTTDITKHKELQVQIHIDAFCPEGPDGFVFEENYFEPLRDAIKSCSNTCDFDGDVEEEDMPKIIYIRDQLLKESEFINQYIEKQIEIKKKEQL